MARQRENAYMLSESPSHVEHDGEIAKLLDAMTLPGGVSLRLAGSTLAPVAVLLVEIEHGERLVLDATAAPDVAGALVAGRAFHLSGQALGAMVDTEALTATPLDDVPGRLRFGCTYPAALNVWHRRGAFRVRLLPSMEVAVEVSAEGTKDVLRGVLLNLSLGGCLLRLPRAAGVDKGGRLARIEAVFPNGQRFSLPGTVRHLRMDERQREVLLGCEFSDVSDKDERVLWFLVQEIERESTRQSRQEANSGQSTLFQASVAGARKPSRQRQADYATPMARRLARLASYLNVLVAQLQQGAMIDSSELSRHGDILLGLLEEDREALLFASVCLHDEPELIQHSLAVAIRLTDMARQRGIPAQLLKAIVAAALVHDLGKALLPDELRQGSFDADHQFEHFSTHVALLEERLGECRWLAPQAIKSLVREVNERLDGSGYPAGKKNDELSELTRMAMVVDAVDAMTRPRPDRESWSTLDVYRHLLLNDSVFDTKWTQRYIRHFGLHPIGSLAQFANGAQGWIQRLNRRGLPIEVTIINPDVQRRTGEQVDLLGAVETLVRAPEPELLPYEQI